MRPNHDAAEEEVEAPHRRRLATPSTTAASHGDQQSSAEPPQATRPLVDPRYRFLARFGATILSGGIAAIPMALYHYQAELGLVPQEVWFVGYILAHRWTDALPFPSLRRMSRRTGVSTQMLHRYKQSLIEKGYLTTIPRHRPSGGRTSNYYDFTGLFKALEEHLMHDRRSSGWLPSVDDDGGDDSPDTDPDQPPLPGARQRAETGAGEGPWTGPVRAELPAPDRQNVPLNQTPFVQSPSLETVAKSERVPRQTRERPSRHSENERPPTPIKALPPSGTDLWRSALSKLTAELSAATISAWIEPLVLEPPPAGAPPGSPLRLVCASAFHLQHVNRRYRAALERALGAPIELLLSAA